MMRSITLLSLVMGLAAHAQPVRKLPGGAVMKPGRPAPVIPLAVPTEMKLLQPLMGRFIATSDVGMTVSVECAATDGGTWLMCDLHQASRSATALIGWDRRARAYRAMVATNEPAAYIYRGRAARGKLRLSAPAAPRLEIDLGGRGRR